MKRKLGSDEIQPKIKEVYELLYNPPYMGEKQITYLVPKVSSLLLQDSRYDCSLLEITIKNHPRLIHPFNEITTLIIHPLCVAIKIKNLGADT